MLAACCRRFVMLALPFWAVSFEAAIAADARRPIEVVPARQIDFWDPEQVKPLIEEIMKGEPKPVEVQVFYSTGIGHFDDFLPGAPELLKEPPAKSHHHRLTFHDGRIARTDCFDAAGVNTSYQVVRSTRSGAPRATGLFRADGTALFYKYADYDPTGRVSTIYTFGADFELRFFEEFTYRGEAVDIRRRDRDRNLQFETIYENGGIYLVMNDVKRRVNTGTRRDLIRGPVKHGLKPMYPGYDTP